MKLRANPRKQLTYNLISLLDKENSTHVRIDKMTDNQIKHRIEEIRMWDTLARFECPMCLSNEIKLDSKASHAINLRCLKCGAHYWMSVSRSLGAKLVIR
jgi:hypothetical protein